MQTTRHCPSLEDKAGQTAGQTGIGYSIEIFIHLRILQTFTQLIN